ncbi:hypothetical protein AURDEDRAFT_176985 [Auricularia subglabra TFB-10046 SS5]|nr:hypothetical protein AURDEDRAFT_176985 [Auricularia subglabra TFB-10046 SS5]
MDNPEGAASACHSMQNAWVADTHLDFKLWLRHRVLGLSDTACVRTVARTAAQGLRRYLFAKSAKERIVNLGWYTEILDVFRVPADSREYRNATFNMDSVCEAIGVSSRLWEADVQTFARGIEGCELIHAWLRKPQDPVLLAKFGNMTRDEFDHYKRDGTEPRERKRPRKDDSVTSTKKARVENGRAGTAGNKAPTMPPPPPQM